MSSTRPGARALTIRRVRDQDDVLSYLRLHFSREFYQGKRSKIVLARSSIIPDKKFAIKVMPMTTDTEIKRFFRETFFLHITSDILEVTRLCYALVDSQTGYLVMPFYKPKNSSDKMVDKYRAPIGYRGPEADHQGDDITPRMCPFKLDVYCLAVCMWQTMTGKSLLKYNALDELNTDTTRVPEQYRALLRNLLEPEPEKRGTLGDFLSQALQLHPELSTTVGDFK